MASFRRVFTQHVLVVLSLFAFITRNNTLKPSLEGLLAQIHMDLSSRRVRPELNLGPADNPDFCYVPRSYPMS